MLSPAIAQLAAQPFLALNAKDAGALNAAVGDTLRLLLGEDTYRLTLKIEPALPDGVAGVPFGLPAMLIPDLPRWGRIHG